MYDFMCDVSIGDVVVGMADIVSGGAALDVVEYEVNTALYEVTTPILSPIVVRILETRIIADLNKVIPFS